MNDIIVETRAQLTSGSVPVAANLSSFEKAVGLILLVPALLTIGLLLSGNRDAAVALVGLVSSITLAGSLIGLLFKRWRSNFGTLAVWSIIGLVCVGIFGSDEKTPAPVPALDMMAAVFKGHYSRDQIDNLLSRVMNRFGEPLTEENYHRFGSVLVQLRKTSHPISEMEILRCMSAMPPKMGFTNSAGMCAAAGQMGLY